MKLSFEERCRIANRNADLDYNAAVNEVFNTPQRLTRWLDFRHGDRLRREMNAIRKRHREEEARKESRDDEVWGFSASNPFGIFGD